MPRRAPRARARLLAGRLLICWPLLVLGGPASAAGPLLDQIRREGTLRCAAMERPGLAERGRDGSWTGLEVDICRAVATAVLGSPARIRFAGLQAPADQARMAGEPAPLMFLTGDEIVRLDLTAQVLPGPAVFIESLRVLVPAASEGVLADRGREGICYLIGDPVENALNGYFAARDRPWIRQAFSETGEMDDAYGVQHCHALAGESTALAAFGRTAQGGRLASRLLPELLDLFPILAVTPTRDGRWSAIVAWTVDTLLNAEHAANHWQRGGPLAMPVKSEDLGLAAQWQERVLAATGHYGDIYARQFGSSKRLILPRGPNASAAEGGLLLAPHLP